MVSGFFSKIWALTLRILFPQDRTCHLCGACLTDDDVPVLCADCMKKTLQNRVSDAENGDPSHAPLTLAVSACWHQDEPRKLVHRLKYGSDQAAAIPLGMMMADAFCSAPPILHCADLVIPVPVHPKRMKERGYNQAELLARAFCSHTELEINTTALVRTNYLLSQIHRNKQERLAAMKGVFSVDKPDEVKGHRILLIDDVLTTGATAQSCAGVLLDAGAAEVFLLTATCA